MRITRRGFIGASAALVAAGGFAGADAAPKLRVCIIGDTKHGGYGHGESRSYPHGHHGYARLHRRITHQRLEPYRDGDLTAIHHEALECHHYGAGGKGPLSEHTQVSNRISRR